MQNINIHIMLNAYYNNIISITINDCEISFTENARLVSSRFRDRPVSSARSVVYWTEYLIEHGDEAHITPLSADATWTCHFLMDLWTTITVICFTVMLCTRIVLSRIRRTTNRCRTVDDKNIKRWNNILYACYIAFFVINIAVVVFNIYEISFFWTILYSCCVKNFNKFKITIFFFRGEGYNVYII